MNTATDASPHAFRYARRLGRLKPSAIREILKVADAPDVVSFAGGLPAPELFPVDAIAQAAQRVLARQGASALQYGPSEGYLPLRTWVCQYLAETVGLSMTPDRVLILHGSQQGLDLVAKVLIDPGDVILTENPAYLGALQAFQAYEPRIVGLTSDQDGLIPAALRAYLRDAAIRPKLLYLNPNFQNPTGTSLASARRADIVALAADYGVPILEDDPYGSLRFSGQPSPALCALDGARDCVYLGTTSKILAPGLRVAWLAAPHRAFFDRVLTAKQAADLHTSSFAQRIVHETVSVPGLLTDHVAHLCQVYGRRRDTMVRALRDHFPSGCTWTFPDGGLFLWVTLPESLDAEALFPAALAQKVAFVPGEPFWVDQPRRNTLRLNFSNADEARIEAGVARFGAVLRTALAAQA